MARYGARLALAAFEFSALACSSGADDCFRARTCKDSYPPIDVSDDGWWHDGAAGQMETANAGAAGADGDAAGAGSDIDLSSGGVRDADAQPSAPDTDAPRVLSVTPADGSVGVPRDVSIAIAFSRAMDGRAVRSAYQSPELPASAVSFEWNADFTVLTLTPLVTLRYARVRADLAATPAQTYHLAFGEAARDQRGQALAAFSCSFSTLREGTLELTADPERTGNWTDSEGEGIHNCSRHPQAPYLPTVCIGDDANDARYTGFISFDLTALPPDLRAISGARLLATGKVYGSPAALGESMLEHLAFGELGEAALRAGPSIPLGPFVTSEVSGGSGLTLDLDVTDAFVEDALGPMRRTQSQYRLGFSKHSSDAQWDDAEFPTANIRLAVSYLVP